MVIEHKISIDMVFLGVSPRVNVVQNDQNTRLLHISLFSNGVAWAIPEGITVLVGYCKPDGKKGLYEKLPDGTVAASISGNVISVLLAPQMLTTYGTVAASIMMVDGSEKLSTFSIEIVVAENPAGTVIDSEDYFNWVSPAIDAKLEEVNDALEKSAVATERAEAATAVSENAIKIAQNADKKVDTLREVVSKFHSNIVEEAKGSLIFLDDASDMELAGMKVFGKTTQNGTPSPEASAPMNSAGDSGSIGLKVFGKNLLKLSEPQSSDDISITYHDDGSITVDTMGKALTANKIFGGRSFDVPPGEYIISGITSASENFYFALVDGGSGGTSISVNTSGDHKVTITTGHVFNARMVVLAGTTLNNVTIYPMMRPASVADNTYEPYANPQTMSISTPNGLPGIPVASGGNYTDENGQQWVCDEADFEKGIYVQRVRRLTASELQSGTYPTGGPMYQIVLPDGAKRTYTDNMAYCTHYPYGAYTNANMPDKHFKVHYSASNDTTTLFFKDTRFTETSEWEDMMADNAVEVLYQLETPVSHSLSEEQLAAYADAALHTNYPNTTIFNDGGAGMEVKYVADTKLYVDKKFAELAAAIVNNT